MKAWHVSLITALVCLLLAWLGGFDFDQRGYAALWTAWSTIGMSAIAFCFAKAGGLK